jgi:hypothetical protein
MLNAIYNVTNNNRIYGSNESSPPFDYAQSIGQLTTPHNILVIRYIIQGQATLLDCWHDPHYFPAAFPALFLMGVGGHLDQRGVSASLVTLAEWALIVSNITVSNETEYFYL